MSRIEQVWGVAHVRPFGADLASRDLRDMGFDVFAPKVRRLEVRHFSRKKTLKEPIESPLFRGYLFIGWPLASAEWGRATKARGLIDLVRSCGKDSSPARMPSLVMKGLLDAGEVIDLTGEAAQALHDDFKPGDLVFVRRDAFHDHLFRIARLDPRSRIRFLLQSCRPGFEKFEIKASADDLKKALA